MWISFERFVRKVQRKNLTREDSRRPCSFQLNFVIWGLFCFLAAILFFKILSKFVQTVHTNFHAESGLCSSRNERVMLNFAIWRPFCFSKFCQEMSVLCSILWFGGHFVFQIFVKICSDCPYEFGHQLLVLCTCF